MAGKCRAVVGVDWDDGPTAVGSLKGPVRVSRPGNTEEARMMNNSGRGARLHRPPTR